MKAEEVLNLYAYYVGSGNEVKYYCPHCREWIYERPSEFNKSEWGCEHYHLDWDKIKDLGYMDEGVQGNLIEFLEEA